MKRFILTATILLAGCFIVLGQGLRGMVMQINENGDTTAVSMATVQWLHTAVGAHTGQDGTFVLPRAKTDTLVVSFPTYLPDTVVIPNTQNDVTFFLNSAHSLHEVSIVSRDGSFISVQPILTQIISTEGLRRAACCNLSESFEGTVSVDADYPDAVSGARQISMLGLAGKYTQILLENVPFIRILSHQFGLGFVPGSWMESINISKGTASIVNGYEGITGQIDVEYKKPETNLERVFLNVYANSMGRAEASFNSRIPVGKNDKASTNFLVFLADQFAQMDMNNDKFMDAPRSRQVNLANRWDYKGSLVEGRSMVNFVWDNRFGGQVGFKPNLSYSNIPPYYGFVADNKKLQLISKNGFILKGDNESIGTIVSFVAHGTNSKYGDRTYNATQYSGYVNLMYSNKFGTKKRHKLTSGASFQFDYMRDHYTGEDFLEGGSSELLDLNGISNLDVEAVPGIFAEYAYIIDPKLVLMAGMRLDYNSMYNKLFWTPRLHAKWQVTKDFSLRASAGKGYRTSHFFPENLSLLISSRNIRIDEQSQAEEAYNYGVSAVYQFNMPGGKASLAVDYFYTTFMQQMIVDLDNPREIHYYALNGYHNGFGNHSRSHSAQIELTLKPLQRFEILLAYRYNDVRYSRKGEIVQKELMSPHKALVNLNYSTPYDKWKFNINCQIFGPMLLPDTKSNPEQYQRPDYSKPYCLLNAQITKKFRRWEIYVGAENMLNVKQKDAIVAADAPLGQYFDATMIYAPITGIMAYGGFRFILK